MPEPTYEGALAQLLAFQQWRRLPLGKDGKPYGAAYFSKYNWC